MEGRNTSVKVHPLFITKIAGEIVERRRDLGSEEAAEYAERFTDLLTEAEWTELIKDIQRIKSDDESS